MSVCVFVQYTHIHTNAYEQNWDWVDRKNLRGNLGSIIVSIIYKVQPYQTLYHENISAKYCKQLVG